MSETQRESLTQSVSQASCGVEVLLSSTCSAQEEDPCSPEEESSLVGTNEVLRDTVKQTPGSSPFQPEAFPAILYLMATPVEYHLRIVMRR